MWLREHWQEEEKPAHAQNELPLPPDICSPGLVDFMDVGCAGSEAHGTFLQTWVLRCRMDDVEIVERRGRKGSGAANEKPAFALQGVWGRGGGRAVLTCV